MPRAVPSLERTPGPPAMRMRCGGRPLHAARDRPPVMTSTHQAFHPAFAGSRHDHERCAHAALDEAARVCASQGARLTAVRRQVLELIWRSHAPIGAYDLLAALNGAGRKAAPPTVYRALEFLLRHGLIHRIESRNAYVGCALPSRHHVGQFLICRACGNAAEIDDSAIARAIARSTASLGFAPERIAVEISGRCERCAAADRA